MTGPDAPSASTTVRGRFITVEGVEGVGKSTCISTIVGRLERAGLAVCQTREPGGSPNAERIRDLLLSRDTRDLPDVAELLLMFAARADHIHNTIAPALAAGTWVVSDRFTDSSFAYQGGGRGLSVAMISQLESWVAAEMPVDCTFLLDLSPETAQTRIGSRDLDRIEAEDLGFFHRTRAAFLARAEADPERFVIVDAGQTQLLVAQALERHLDAILGGVQ